MTESNIEKLISDYLDSVYVVSHSQASVDCYKSTLNHFNKFVQSKHDASSKLGRSLPYVGFMTMLFTVSVFIIIPGL